MTAQRSPVGEFALDRGGPIRRSCEAGREALVAQWIERCPPEAEAAGSNPAECATNFNRLRQATTLQCCSIRWSGCRRGYAPGTEMSMLVANCRPWLGDVNL